MNYYWGFAFIFSVLLAHFPSADHLTLITVYRVGTFFIQTEPNFGKKILTNKLQPFKCLKFKKVACYPGQFGQFVWIGFFPHLSPHRLVSVLKINSKVVLFEWKLACLTNQQSWTYLVIIHSSRVEVGDLCCDHCDSKWVCCDPCDSKWVCCDLVRPKYLPDFARPKTNMLRSYDAFS